MSANPPIVTSFPPADEPMSHWVNEASFLAYREWAECELTALRQSREWLPIETYPRERDEGAQTWWGPEVAVLCAAAKGYIICGGIAQPEFDVKPSAYVAHLEAGEWLTRSGDDPIAWFRLHKPPTHWQELPSAPEQK